MASVLCASFSGHFERFSDSLILPNCTFGCVFLLCSAAVQSPPKGNLYVILTWSVPVDTGSWRTWFLGPLPPASWELWEPAFVALAKATSLCLRSFFGTWRENGWFKMSRKYTGPKGQASLFRFRYWDFFVFSLCVRLLSLVAKTAAA